MGGRIGYYGGIVRDGLVLDLDAAKLDSYPRTGRIWNDISANGNNGTLINGPSFDSENGGSIVFDGVDDYVSTTLNLGSNPLPAHTISVWFKTSVASGKKLIGIESTQTGTSSAHDRHLYVGTNGKVYYGVYDSTFRYISSTISVTGNTWVNAIGVSTGNNSIMLYMNGVIDTTGVGNGFSLYTTSYIKIGGFLPTTQWPNSLSGVFTGNISQCQIYNRALSATEILQNYNAIKSRYGL